ncbi:pyruvate dehydrogenase [Drechmeria coniospora]|uniref:Pyruvate dehydrogenase n=1 Tax=Drechmeria coniospora TaxID=98403 RepID=A0A151GBM1_DRECN|nr:pyruvate dehydrogenase [Drechmeria coniospora]KYK54453.1 pyruvate dehydrogenase [Drechmeria coniospora]
MFRVAAHSVRLATKGWPTTRRRLASTTSTQLQPSRTPAWAAGVLFAGVSGYYFGKGAKKHDGGSIVGPIAATGTDGMVPGMPPTMSEDDIPAESPVKVLDLKESNEKIRHQSHSFVFDSQDGNTGRADVVRVSSNHPVEDEWALAVAEGLGGGKALYAGVYDGHAGWATSAILKESLIPFVSTALRKLSSADGDSLVDGAIKKAFVSLDDRIMRRARSALDGSQDDGSAEAVRALAPAIAGSCALLSIYDPISSTLRTAVTGDSRAVLGSWSSESARFSAHALSEDQTGFNKDECDRLEAEHPGETADMIDPKTGRLMGIAITRAFGDHRWKWPNDVVSAAQLRFFAYGPRAKSKSPPYMTARPEVTTRKVAADDFVILASDGLWDVISNDDAVACIQRWLAAKKAGRAETVTPAPSKFAVGEDGYASWKATPEMFAIEDLDSAAVCLVKNALGGRRRAMFCGAMTAYAPVSRYVRDDMTVQVIFFRDPYKS